jgi:hypothetical protein
MRRHLILAAAALIALCGARMARADSWIFRASYYTHDLATGQRVAQFAPAVTPCVAIDPTYQRSGYVHSESTLRVGDSAEHTNIVETWGQGASIRPYGEWLYPYRPGATPYNPGGSPRGPWANPYGTAVNPYAANPAPNGPGMVPPYTQPSPAPYGQPSVGPYAQPGPAPYGQPSPAPYGQPGAGIYPPSSPAPPAPPAPGAPGGAGNQ